MDKTKDAYKTIGEVSRELDILPHVLRFWESKFTQVKPVKRAIAITIRKTFLSY